MNEIPASPEEKKAKPMLPQTLPADGTTASVTVAGPRYEHLKDGLGIGTPRPRLSWITQASHGNWLQSGYEIEAYRPDGHLHERTGLVGSGDSVLIPWPFAALTSRERLCTAGLGPGPLRGRY